MKTLTMAALLLLSFVSGGVVAYEIMHPNLKEALQMIDRAREHMHVAYENNGDKGAPFGGHLEAADRLLEQAKGEIVEADRFRNEHYRK